MKANRLDPLTFIALHTSANDDKIEVKGHSDKTNTHDIFVLLSFEPFLPCASTVRTRRVSSGLIKF